MNYSPEILSPAGSWESLTAAAAAGADAVYFGGSSFNARRNADNFSDSDIPKVVSYCHVRGIKAYFTLNTIVFDSEIEKALELAALVCAAGADAIILQDIGLAALIHKTAPLAKLHASTQISVHNLSGVRELSQMGFFRVVLARELSRKELAAIAGETPVELEVFVHGALCMSVSGQCYMSAFFQGSRKSQGSGKNQGPRSANRGLCAQPCRLPFCSGTHGNVLSLKDLSLIDYIGEMAGMGITSLKIEGRMKRPEYVAAATAACKKAASGIQVTVQEKEELLEVFSRDGFTAGYYGSKIGQDMFGVRTHENVLSATPILKRFRSLYDGVERQNIKVDFEFSLKKDGVSLKSADSDGNTVIVTGSQPEKALHRPIDKQTVAEKLAKTGATPFFPGSVNVSLEPGLTVPVSAINGLRREALSQLLEIRGRAKPVPFDFEKLKPAVFEGFPTGKAETVEKYRLRFHSVSQIGNLDLKQAEIVFLPLKEICDGKAEPFLKTGVRIGAEIPRAVFSGASELLSMLKASKAAGVCDALCGNIGAVGYARRAGLKIHGDFGLNVANSAALEAYKACGTESCLLSFETPATSVRGIASRKIMPCGIIVYGRLPLMLVRNCPVRSFSGCKGSCCSIKDRIDCEFPLLCNHDKNGASEILNSRPLWLADLRQKLRHELAGIDFAQFYFTIENADEVKKVIEAWHKGAAFTGEFTRGLYFRPLT